MSDKIREAAQKVVDWWMKSVGGTGFHALDKCLFGLEEALASQPAQDHINGVVNMIEQSARVADEPVAYAVPQSRAMPDGSMEDGPEQLLPAADCSEYEKKIGFPLYTKPQPSDADALNSKRYQYLQYAHPLSTSIWVAHGLPQTGISCFRLEELDGFIDEAMRKKEQSKNGL